jgi:hypothetical protein
MAWIVTSETTTLFNLAGAWRATGLAVEGIAVGVTSSDTSPPLGAGTIPREEVEADGAGFGVAAWVEGPAAPVAGSELGVLAPDGAEVVVETASLGAAELATPPLEPGVSALPGAFVAELPTGEELAAWL